MRIQRLMLFSVVIVLISPCKTNAQDNQDSEHDVRVAESNIGTEQQRVLQKAFSYSSGLNLDLKSGNSPYAPNLPTNVYSRENIASLKITETDYRIHIGSRETIRIYKYRNGLLLSSYYDASDVDPHETYEYDESGRRIKEGRYFTFSYPESQGPDEIERTVYYMGNYHFTEKIKVLTNGYEVYRGQSNGRESAVHFIYQGGLLRKVIQINITENREWNWFDFNYDEKGLLREIVNATSRKDDIRAITRIIAYDRENIAQMELQVFRQGRMESTEIWTFLNYDEYGNWRYAECYSRNELRLSYHREIEYN